MRRTATIANCEKMARKKKNRFPENARTEILTTLRKNYRISLEKMLDIVAKAVPFDKADKPLRAFWLDKCRKLLSSIRDEDGRRMVFNIPANKSVTGCSEYVLVCTCTDPQELAAIRHRLHSDVAGLEKSIDVIDIKMESLEQICRQLDNAINGRKKGQNNVR